MEIVGLSGYARSGKDEAAKVLVEEFGFRKIAFADKLREMIYALNPIVEYKYDGPVRVQQVIDAYSWDNYKSTEYGSEIRSLLQRLGTEAGRNILGESVWIEAALNDIGEGESVVISDCRFKNEASAIRARGGKIWRIHRAGTKPARDAQGRVHESETALNDYRFDRVIFNTGSLEHYQELVRKTYKEVL